MPDARIDVAALGCAFHSVAPRHAAPVRYDEPNEICSPATAPAAVIVAGAAANDCAPIMSSVPNEPPFGMSWFRRMRARSLADGPVAAVRNATRSCGPL